jgi:hypothetical protein
VRAWLLVLLMACRAGEPAAPGGASAPRLPGAPPAGAIVAVAITEAGDAAISFDEGGGWRLWPALDGTREPVVLQASAPRRVALGRDGDGLVAGVLDDAGAIELIRMTRVGAVIGRARLGADPGFDELVAFAGGILALGRDQVIAWYDARGASRGRLAPPRGELLVEVPARRGVALAGIGKVDRGAVGARLIEVRAGGLRWGAYTRLPDPLRGLALAPDHRRIAGIRAGTTVGQVIALGGAKLLELDLTGDAGEEPAAIGFLAPGPAVMSTLSGIRRSGADLADPGPGFATTPAVVGDALAVFGRGEALGVVDRSRVRLLGYGQVGAGPLVPAGAGFAMDTDGQLQWLDGRLAAARATDEPGRRLRVALDDRLFAELVSDPADPDGAPVRLESSDPERPDAAQIEIELHDTITGAASSIGRWRGVLDLRLDPRSRVLAISHGREAHRFRVDARGLATPLPSLPLQYEGAFVYPLDPRAAGGVIALAIRADRDADGEHPRLSIETHRERGRPARRTEVGRLLGVDDTGAIWLARERAVVALRGDEPVARLELDAPIDDGVASRGGSFAVVRAAHEVIAVDARGAVRWRREVLRAHALAISGDDRTVAVTTSTGLVALDAATGERRGWACGWRFGLHESLPTGADAACQPD